MIKDCIAQLIQHKNLSPSVMTAAMEQIMEGRASDAQVASFLTALSIKGETVDEISAAARVMRAKATPIPIASNKNLVDIVGTGGDMANTFNVSTAAAFVAAGAGLKIAKHGNRSASSNCGSADVIEQMNININISPENTAECIDQIGIGFLFAKNLHRAMKYAAIPRKDIGIKTVFNILGPLTNPADAEIQVLGVYSRDLAAKMAAVLKNLGRKRALVVHGRDGLDEITLCDTTDVYDLKNGQIKTYEIVPAQYDFTVATINDISGGSPNVNAEIIMAVLKGEKSPCRDITILNAAAAILAAEKTADMTEAVQTAAESIDSGRALQKLKDLARLTEGMT